jgi:hypothetical protein
VPTELQVLSQFFCENYQFFEVFEITGTGGSSSLILISQNTRTGSSLIVKYVNRPEAAGINKIEVSSLVRQI